MSWMGARLSRKNRKQEEERSNLMLSGGTFQNKIWVGVNKTYKLYGLNSETKKFEWRHVAIDPLVYPSSIT